MTGATLRMLFMVSFPLLIGLAGAALQIDTANRARQRLAVRLGKIGSGALPAVAVTTSARIALKRAGPIERIAGLIGCDYEHRQYYPLPWWLLPILAGVAGRVAVWLAAGLLGGAAWAALPVVCFLVCRSVFGSWNAKRKDRLLLQFPDALSMIVRTVRVGIPVQEGIRLCAREAADPTGAEFRRLVEEIGIGVPLDVALRATAERTAMAEYRFFATAVALQMQTGGGLADALENLADVVRRRLALRNRGFALTSEARTSALVLAVMPFFVGLVMTISSPGYLDVMFTTDTGNEMLGIGILSLCIGIAAMRVLIRQTLA